MGITNRDFGKALNSSEAQRIRGKMGHRKGNKFIQDIHNKLHMSRNQRKCGFD